MMKEASLGNRAFSPLPPPSISAGRYEVRMAATNDEIEAAQKLRYRIMYAESGGHPDLEKIRMESDADEWDSRAFHVIVVDKASAALRVMGTLRLVSNLNLEDGQKFYTEHAYDLTKLRDRYASILELGRFCIDAEGRQGVILMLIWKFTMQFIVDNRIDVMVGCASFHGTNVDVHGDVLGYLYRHNLAPEALRPSPVVDNHVRIDGFARQDVDFERATRSVPTLLRGYLKLGARVSDTAMVDPVFNSTFVCIYVDSRDMLAENTVLVTSKRRRKP